MIMRSLFSRSPYVMTIVTKAEHIQTIYYKQPCQKLFYEKVAVVYSDRIKQFSSSTILFAEQFQTINYCIFLCEYVVGLIIYQLQYIMERKAKIHCYAVPFFGHAMPVLRIAQYLTAETKHQVKFFTSNAISKNLKEIFPSVDIVGLDDKMDPDKMWNEMTKNFGQTIQHGFDKYWKSHFQTVDKPDLLIADFGTAPAYKWAVKNNITLFIVENGSQKGTRDLVSSPTFRRSFGFCGLTVLYPHFLLSLVAHFRGRSDQIFRQFQNHAFYIYSNFIGLEDADISPPNVLWAGPLICPKYHVLKDNSIINWMEERKSKGLKRFVYVSFGSAIKLSKELMVSFFEGFVKSGYPVIWSLKTNHTELVKELKHENILIRDWFPQASVLQLDEVKVFITHCGWNGLTEAVYYGKVMVMIPWCNDEPFNADMIARKGCGFSIFTPKSLSYKQEISVPELTANRIKDSLDRAMNDKQLQENAGRLSVMAKDVDGLSSIVRQVSYSLNVGHLHLIDRNYIRANKRTAMTVIKSFALAVVIILLYLFRSRFF